MTGSLSDPQSSAIFQDLLLAEQDLKALAAGHGLSLEELADWFDTGPHRRRLAGLCAIEDCRAQALISRFRTLAATRLISLATQETGESAAAVDVARKACVDLLRVELPRVVIDPTQDPHPTLPGLPTPEALYGPVRSVHLPRA